MPILEFAKDDVFSPTLFNEGLYIILLALTVLHGFLIGFGIGAAFSLAKDRKYSSAVGAIIFAMALLLTGGYCIANTTVCHTPWERFCFAAAYASTSLFCGIVALFIIGLLAFKQSRALQSGR